MTIWLPTPALHRPRSLGLPVARGTPVLGTWQGVFLYEHRYGPHRRKVMLHLIGE